MQPWSRFCLIFRIFSYFSSKILFLKVLDKLDFFIAISHRLCWWNKISNQLSTNQNRETERLMRSVPSRLRSSSSRAIFNIFFMWYTDSECCCIHMVNPLAIGLAMRIQEHLQMHNWITKPELGRTPRAPICERASRAVRMPWNTGFLTPARHSKRFFSGPLKSFDLI